MQQQHHTAHPPWTTLSRGSAPLAQVGQHCDGVHCAGERLPAGLATVMLFLHGGVFQDAAATASCAVLRGPRQKLYSLVLGLCWPCVCCFSIQCPVFQFAPSSFMCHPCADILSVPVSYAGTAGEARVSCMSADHTRMQPAQPWCLVCPAAFMTASTQPQSTAPRRRGPAL